MQDDRAAAGDIHASEPTRERLADAFAAHEETPMSSSSPAT